ncbi:zinc finger protein 516 [Desmodus rotundus]|uniref:zinc finger protein 516 n=1 Tax=Desmodus rotundus TaxID=9430 RepID=UPI0023812247|nr:zinc finger protein 516 [Desmodus rotundus]XP_045043625.2 zinc finger protein 516 [Desmodus rotundus]XP_045043626.2 zinc finger protein 516 [Desmodus rotundus]XP_053768346.1 zinc finger protein 516 [Desmodus rotundus]XP_053768347.1 zinc finger protein 516 [Desmodus rotundus]XP_053768348.1 zinc finger protein 516 [Desmodus rotundus]
MDRSREAEIELRRGPEVGGDKAVSHSCCICGKSFPFQSSLSQHMRKHTGEKPYKCPYCDHRASQKGNLKIHIRSHRTGTLIQGHEPEAGETRVSEGLDGCTSPTKSTSACNRILNGAAQLDSSKILLRSCRKEAEGAPYAAEDGRAVAQCSFCKSKFQRKKELQRHVHRAHKPFKCRLCSYVTLREESLLSHIEKDHITAQVPSGEACAENGKPELPSGEFPCEVCGQAFSQTWFLKAHMKKHRGSFDHGCHICGRRFKEPWFLKNHMKAHGPKAASKNRPKSELDPIATINNVVQEEAIVAGLALYEICTKCGNLFTNLDSLNAHNAVHRRVEAGRTRAPASEGALGPADSQQLFLQCLNLRPAGTDAPAHTQAGQRVAELDPVNSYQAWQLATRGRVVELAEYLKYGAWDEALGGDVAFDKERREYILVSQEKRKRELEPGAQGPPRKRMGTPGDLMAGPPDSRSTAARPSRRATTPAGHGKSSECFECGKIFRTYHQMVLHSRVHRRVRRDQDGPGGRMPHLRSGSLSEGDSASQPSSPGSACAATDSPGSGLAEEAADESGEESTADAAPGAKPRGCCFSEDVASVLSNGGHSLGDALSAEHNPGRPCVEVAIPVSAREDHGREMARRPEPPRFSVDLKMPAYYPKQEVLGARDTAGVPSSADQTCVDGAAWQRWSESPASRLKEQLCGLHNKERPGQGPRALAPDLAPLDLSERSTRDDRSHKELASSLQAALAVHPCPYCSHKSYYPEVLWMHKRIWHRVSCSAVAPQWMQPNGCRSIRNNLVFLVRSGRTGPPPALGGKECQPLPIARFTRTQVPGGAPGPKGSSLPLGGTAKATGTSKSREGQPGGPCALWAAGSEGLRQTKPGHSPEQHSALAPTPPPRPKQEAGPRPAPVAGSGFSRSATPTPAVIARAGSQSPATSKLGDKCVIPAAGAGLGAPNKHSALDPLKAKSSPQPQGLLHRKGDGGPPLPPREPPSKASQGPRGSTALQAQPVLQATKQESASEGPEKRLDILSIFKTYIPKDLATLYQSWGAEGPALEHRGTLQTQAHQGDFVCVECGKCFHQPSHLRAHTRAHSVVFDSDGLRGAEVLAASMDAPKQGRDPSSPDAAPTVPLRKGT